MRYYHFYPYLHTTEYQDAKYSVKLVGQCNTDTTVLMATDKLESWEFKLEGSSYAKLIDNPLDGISIPDRKLTCFLILGLKN